MLVGPKARGFIPILVDQTNIGGVQTLMAGLIFSGRVLPVAFTCFTYEEIRRSHNAIETAFMTLIRAVFPYQAVPLFIADRQYGRIGLIEALKNISATFVLRTKGKGLVRLSHDGAPCLLLSCVYCCACSQGGYRRRSVRRGSGRLIAPFGISAFSFAAALMPLHCPEVPITFPFHFLSYFSSWFKA